MYGYIFGIQYPERVLVVYTVADNDTAAHAGVKWYSQAGRPILLFRIPVSDQDIESDAVGAIIRLATVRAPLGLLELEAYK